MVEVRILIVFDGEVFVVDYLMWVECNFIIVSVLFYNNVSVIIVVKYYFFCYCFGLFSGFDYDVFEMVIS